MRKIYYTILLIIFMQACTTPSYRRGICVGDYVGPFEPYASEGRIVLTGKAKVVLPKYRVRGLCRIESSNRGELLIDFRHSSLFGAYREDAAIMIIGGELSIIDRERGRFYESDSAVAIIGSVLELTIYPDDILYALLLASPGCSEISGLERGEAGDRWYLRGEWRGRNIEMEGRNGSMPERFRICSLDGINCYVISYKYNRTDSYPRRLDLVREGYGDERIVLEILDEETTVRPVDIEETPAEGRLRGLVDSERVGELSRSPGVSFK
jgi:hypothetical protein